MESVVHFEMPAQERPRMIDFYSKVFGWHSVQLDEKFGSYVTVQTAETDENNMVKQPGAINGGFYQKTKDDQTVRVVVGVKDIHESMKKVEESGGKIIGGGHQAGQPDDIPGVGLYILVEDTEGNRVGLLQPKGSGIPQM